MKLAKVSVSVAVIVGAIATGGSWYTGKQIEQRYGELVQKANHSLQQLKTYGMQAEIRDIKLERGLFSSDIQYTFDVQTDSQSYQFKGNDKLYHGPFPLNRLVKGQVLPVMASIDSNVQVPENLKEFFSQETLLAGLSTLNYSEEWDGQFKTSPVKLPQFGNLELSEIVYDGTLDKQGNGKGKINFPQIKFQSMNDNPEDILLKDIEYNFTLDHTREVYPFLNIGDMDVKANLVRISNASDKNFDLVEFTNVVSKSVNRVKDENYSSYGNFSAKLMIGHKDTRVDLGRMNLDVALISDAKFTNDLTENLSNPEKLEENNAQVLENFVALLNKGLQFHIKDFSFENSKGKSSIELALNFGEKFEFEDIQRTPSAWLNIFKPSNLSVKLHKPMLSEWVKNFVSLNPETRDQADKIADEQMENLSSLAAQSDFIVTNEDRFELKLEISEGKLKLNNRELSDQELQGLLLMLVFGTMDMMQ